MPERKPLDDRQLDAVLERLDKLVDEIHVLNRRLDHAEGFARVAHELRTLNESLRRSLTPRSASRGRRSGADAPANRLAGDVAGRCWSGHYYCRRKMSRAPLVRWSFALPSGTATRPSVTIGLFQWLLPTLNEASSLPVVGA